MVDRQYVMATLRSKKRMPGRELEIECDGVRAIPYRDILEIFLSLSGVAYWRWFDSQGNTSPRQSLVKALVCLLHDVLLWPFLYLVRSRVVAQLSKDISIPTKLGDRPCALFLRTDQWFNVKSGGSVAHLKGVIDGLRQIGHRIHVVSTDHLFGVEADKDFHLCKPVYERGRNLPNMSELLYNDQLARFIVGRWKEWMPAFIYQRYSLGNYTGVLLRGRYRVPYVCEYNGSFPWMARHWRGRRLFHEKLMTRIELLNLHAADLIVVVSQPLKDELVARGIEPSKILVNPNGVDPERYAPGVDGTQIRSSYGMEGKTVIGFIGTFGAWHGAEVLAEAFGVLIETRPSYRKRLRLLLIGDGVKMPQVKESLAKFGVAELCVLTGLIPQSQGPTHLAACDILASPHRPNPDGTPFFGSPTKLFEYMAMGKAIVASDLNQIGEILKHERTALLVRPGDAKSLMLALRELVDNEQRRKRLGQAARREVIAKYGWGTHTRKIVEKLKERCQCN